ncbi:MAG: hypothetical protein EOO17_00025 [Chloroflexi bacterium]|nr:MAG: hypothetical protein EOO17_00025 [Chloroflexota bacterium]
MKNVVHANQNSAKYSFEQWMKFRPIETYDLKPEYLDHYETARELDYQIGLDNDRKLGYCTGVWVASSSLGVSDARFEKSSHRNQLRLEEVQRKVLIHFRRLCDDRSIRITASYYQDDEHRGICVIARRPLTPTAASVNCVIAEGMSSLNRFCESAHKLDIQQSQRFVGTRIDAIDLSKPVVDAAICQMLPVLSSLRQVSTLTFDRKLQAFVCTTTG